MIWQVFQPIFGSVAVLIIFFGAWIVLAGICQSKEFKE